jgi:hypothetical protein
MFYSDGRVVDVKVLKLQVPFDWKVWLPNRSE